MENRLAGLKKSMTKHIFKDISFSKEQQNAVKEIIQQKRPSMQYHEDTLWTIFTSIEKQPKHGFEILRTLFQKGDTTFDQQEGHLYTLLHSFESKGYIKSEWANSDNEKTRKFYFLTKKGKKALYKASQQKEKAPSLKYILEGSLSAT